MGIQEKLSYCRKSKNCRMAFVGALVLIVLALIFFWGKAKGMLIAILVMLLLAFGVELFDYDLDLGRLWETGSISESRVENRNGMRIFGEKCVSDNINCSHFKTQIEAQTLYDTCAEQIALDNGTTKENVRNIDIYGLDKNKNGIVCEALPVN